jgi:DNA polymerase III subunit beta
MTMNETTERPTKAKPQPLSLSVQVAKRDLSRLAGQMAGIAERKGTMPILACVRMTAAAGRLTLEATNLYQSLTGSIVAVEVDVPGSVAVSAKDLLDRVKLMPDGPLLLEVKDNVQLTLKTKGSARRYTLRGMPGEDFPPMPKPDERAIAAGIPAGLLRRLIARTHFAVSTDETRAHLNSALLEWEGERMRMVATDGHRLAMADAQIDGRSGSSTMLLPLKALHEIARLCDEVAASDDGTTEGTSAGAELELLQSGPMAFFRSGDSMFGVKTVDATFPPYMQVIPKSSARTVKAPRTSLIDAVRAVSVAANQATNGVKMAITKGKIRLTGESPETGDGADEVDVEFDGKSLNIGLCARYVTDALGAVADDDVELGFGEELDPMVIRVGTEFTGVIMPMRI